MHRFQNLWLIVPTLLVAVFALGCSKPSASQEKPADGVKEHDHAHMDDITAAFASLSAEDRAAAEAQKYCAVEQENLLGSMGAPYKVMLDGEAVFLCCEGCKDKALADPKATLAAVAKLKQSATATP